MAEPATAPPRPVTRIAAAPRFERGDFVADGLQVMEVLGEGGFGVVYLAAALDTGQLLALKALRSELLRDARAVEMFRKEAGIWIELGRHPFLVKAEWVNEIGGRLYLAMEYVRGRPGQPASLEGMLAQGAPPFEQALAWAIEFCHGMEHALSRGIRCHRDVKPANILIAEDGRVRISDFGIAGLAVQPESLAGVHAAMASTPAGSAPSGAAARVADPARTVVGTVFGTPSHMSPEQFENAASCDERSDLYSFGVVLHQLATGRLPFYPDPPAPGRDPSLHYWTAFHRLHREAPLPSPPASPLAGALARCLRKARAERYASFRELRADLESLQPRRDGRQAASPAAAQESVADLVNRGISLSTLGRIPEAVACYERALALAPDEKVIHNNLGNALRQLGRTGEALRSLERALAIDPAYDDAWSNKGLLFAQAGRLAEALHSFDQAIVANVRGTAAWIGKGHVLGRLGRPAEELACLERALAIEPRDPAAWFNKGNLLSGSDQAQALACYERALESNPRYAQAWGAKALVLAEAGRHDEALACFDEALGIEPRDAQLHYNKGNVYAGSGRFPEARACFDAATRLPDCPPIAFYNRALAEHQLGRFDDALASLRAFAERASRGDPFLPGALALIGRLESGDRSPLRTSMSGERIEAVIETIAIPEPAERGAPAAPASPAGATAPAAAGAPAVPGASAPGEAHADALGPTETAGRLSHPQAAPSAAHPPKHGLPAVASPPQAAALPPRPQGTAESWNAQCAALYREERLAEAEQAALNALRLRPKDATALNNLANVLLAQGRREEALDRLEQALLASPDHLDAWFNKAIMESQAGRKADALRSLLELLELARDGRGARLVSQAQAARAGLEREGVRPAPRNHLGWLALGFQSAVAGQHDKALACFDQALAQRREIAQLWDWKGSALREANRLDEALACYDSSLAAGAPPWAELHHGRGITLAKLRRFEDAVAAFDQALALDPEHAASWSDRGKALGILKRHAEALESFGRAAALAPDNPAPWQNQALLAEQLGRPEQALSCYRAFLERAKPDMRLQVEHAKARVQVLEGRVRPQATPEAPSRVVRTAGHLDAVLATLLPLSGLDEAEQATIDVLRRAGRREEALVRLAGAEAAARYLASPGDPADLDALAQALPGRPARAAAGAPAANAHPPLGPASPPEAPPAGTPPQPGETPLDAMRRDPALRGLVPFADVSSAEMAEVAKLMDAGREDEAFEQLAQAEARAEAARGGPTPEEAATSEAALDALMAIVDQRVAEQMAREAAEKAGPGSPPGPRAKPPRPGNPVARKYAERAAEAIRARQYPKALESLDQAIGRDPSVALFFSERGQALTHLGRLAEARESYEKALSLDPECVPALVELARLRSGAGRYAEALALAGRAIGAAPGTQAAWSVVGSVLVHLQSWPKAAQAYQVLVKLSPKDAAAWVALGQALERMGRHTAALEALDVGLGLDPGIGEGHYQRGNALVELGRMEEAAAAYERCVELEPARANAWYNLGFARNELGRHQLAIAACETAIAHYPAFDRAWLSKGVALAALGRLDEALLAYDQALAITPGYVLAFDNKGDVLRRLGRLAEAIAAYEAALAQRPEDARALRARAELLDETDRREEAVTAYEALLAVAKLVPADSRRLRDRIAALRPAPEAEQAAVLEPIPEAAVPQVLPSLPPPDCQKRGEMALNQGQIPRALEWFDQAIAGDPRNYATWAGKADALFALKRHLECVAHVNRALELKPRFVLGWQKKAQALHAAGRLDEALAAWDAGLELQPANIQLWNGRGVTLVAGGRDAEAVASLERALAADPRFSLARYNKALAEERLGRYADAARSYQQFLAVAPPHLGAQIQEARRKIEELKPR